MASFWGRVRGFFGGGQPPSDFETSAPSPGASPVPRAAAPASAASPAKNPYLANEEVLGLSAEELRKRALKITPWRTAWIGRTDVIPPQSDERTAIVDRGLVLRGLLTKEQLAEIHTVGDQWLKHHEAMSMAGALAAKSADQAVEQRRKEKAQRKAEKQKLAQERAQARAAEVARRKKEEVAFLGPGVSSGLSDRRSNIEALAAAGLPVLSTPADVAKALEVTVPELRWLCFHSEAAERTHYRTFEVPKRSGGVRLLAAPKKKLAKAQGWVLRSILEKLPTEKPAHGFVKGRSIVSNAAAHLGRDVVVNLDLKDFFPTVTFPRIRGVFKKAGYSPAVATVLALLCTESPRREVEYEGRRYFVAVGPRALPQGACTSPALSNQVARKLDRRLRGRMAKLGFEYTRYADDLTFSAPPGKREKVGFLKAAVRHLVEEEGFTVHPEKGSVLSSSRRQRVTGIVVNRKLSVPREQVRRLRAILHQARKTGLAAQNREGRPNFEAYLQGMIAWVSMVDREKGQNLARQLAELVVAGRRAAG
ncbi:MAG: RNA-directed DNA polymerase [Myxococcales bacterium]|nr:RNA-directed DNA polymerase [Myxococcales bacterium]